jgi:opacity protein-like surface antigen
MKRIWVIAFMLITGTLHAEMAKDIAGELADSITKGERLRVAILPLEYRGRAGHPLGRQLADDLTYWLVKSKKVTVVERAMVDKVMQELAFQQTGAIDDTQAQKIGRGLGAQALILGTITDGDKHRAVIQTRIIRTETFEVISVSKFETRRDWEQEYVPASPPPPRLFIDALGGIGSGDMTLEFINKVQKVNTTYLGIVTNPPNQSFNSISFPNVKTTPGMVFGARGHFYTKYLGFGGEFLRFTHSISNQKSTWRADGIENDFNFSQDDYLSIAHNQLSLQILLRVNFWRIFMPYVGVGAGLSFVQLKSGLIYSYTYDSKSGGSVFSKGVDTTEMGYGFHALGGLRLIFGYVTFFAEARIFSANASFTRDINGETDEVNIKGWQALAGVGAALSSN